MQKIFSMLFHFHFSWLGKNTKIYPGRLALFTSFMVVILFGIISIYKGCTSIPHSPPYKIIKGKITQDAPFYISLQASGISPEAIYELTESLKEILDFGQLQVNDQYQLFLSPDKKIQKFIYTKNPFDQYFAVRTATGTFSAFKPTIYINKKIIAKEFSLKSSLFATMLAGGEKPKLIMEYVNIFSWDIDFHTFPEINDKIRILFEKYEKDGKFVKYGKILSGQYITPSKTFSAIFYEYEKGKYGYYDLAGKPVEKQFLKSPLKFTGRITSLFSYHRLDPILHVDRAHYGVDFAAPTGSPIVATASGKVIFTGWKGGYGNAVIIRHNNGYKTLYGHCSRIYTKVGYYVNQGEIIAGVGSTGWSTGPHVHYGMYLNGTPINPLKVSNKPKGKPLKKKQLEKYYKIRDLYLNQMDKALNTNSSKNR